MLYVSRKDFCFGATFFHENQLNLESRKMPKVFYEGDLNFAEMNKRLKKEKPVKLTNQEIVNKLREGLEAALANGVSHERLVEILRKDYEIDMAVNTLRKYLSEGKPGTRMNSLNAENAADGLLEKHG